MHARAVHRAEHLEAEVEQLRGENSKLQDRLFGRKNKTASDRDRSNRLEDEEDRDLSTPPLRGQRKDRPVPKRRDYGHLPVVEDLRELPEDRLRARSAAQCFRPAIPSIPNRSRSRSEAIDDGFDGDVIQRTCTCSKRPRIVTATTALKLIPKGVLGVSVWVEILLDKIASHRPSERLLG